MLQYKVAVDVSLGGFTETNEKNFGVPKVLERCPETPSSISRALYSYSQTCSHPHSSRQSVAMCPTEPALGSCSFHCVHIAPSSCSSKTGSSCFFFFPVLRGRVLIYTHPRLRTQNQTGKSRASAARRVE